MISSQKILNINQFCASSIYTLWLKYNLVWNLLGSHKIYLGPTKSTKISPDLLGSQKIYWDLKELLRSNKHYWDPTRSTEISQEIQRSHKIYRDLTRSADLTWPDLTFNIWHLTFDISHLAFVIWQLTFYIWKPIAKHLYFLKTSEIYKLWLTQWLNKIDPRDASASENLVKSSMHLSSGISDRFLSSWHQYCRQELLASSYSHKHN